MLEHSRSLYTGLYLRNSVGFLLPQGSFIHNKIHRSQFINKILVKRFTVSIKS